MKPRSYKVNKQREGGRRLQMEAKTGMLGGHQSPASPRACEEPGPAALDSGLLASREWRE